MNSIQRLYMLRLVERQHAHYQGKFDKALAITVDLRELESKYNEDLFVQLVSELSTAPVASISTR